MNYEKEEVSVRAKRNYKDTLFRMIFREPKTLLNLYNAINGTNYTDENELQVVTLENAIYMNMKNDLAFLVDCRLNLYEQQASINPNMPLRDLFYVAKEYQNMVDRRSLYASKLVKIPTPCFIVFYNGTKEQPERLELKLSDAFMTQIENPPLELRVLQLNIREGHNNVLLEKCPILKEYSQYVEKVQRYVKEKELNEAVEQAIHECIREGILSDFLSKNRAEAISVSIFEYDEEKELMLFRQAEREVGLEMGELCKTISLVRKKNDKGMTVKEISELLEEKEIIVEEILRIVAESPITSDEKIAEVLYEEMNYKIKRF